jgi:hypothetical protein
MLVQAWFYHRRQRDEVSQRLHNLKMEDTTPPEKTGARMILPIHLNALLEIFSPGQVLLLDVRSPSDYERSHVHGAANLRIPLKFARQADFPMLERTFTDDQSRRAFSTWQSAKCMVFYDKKVEVPLECPVADALLYKLRNWGWEGQCFILKGHYREFGVTYRKYIVGAQMTQEAKDYVDGLRQRSMSRQGQWNSERRYEEWLSQLETKDRVNPSAMSPTDKDRAKSVDEQQRNLEEEFQRRFPELAKKAMELHNSSFELPPPWEASGWPGAVSPGAPRRGKDNFNMKAGMVEYLDRGLEKIRDHQGPAMSSVQQQQQPVYAEGHSKLAADASYFDTLPNRPPSDGFVEINKGDEQLGDDPGFLRAGQSGEEPSKKGRGGILNKVFRRT